MYKYRLAAVAAVVLMSSGADAAVLDFAGDICGASGTLGCGDGTQIGQNYGDTAFVDVSYRSGVELTGVTLEPFLKTWNGNYGDLTRVVWGGFGPTGSFSEITFTPVAGYEVSLTSLEAGCYVNRAVCQTLNYDIQTGGGATILAGSTPTLFPGHATLAVNSDYFTSGIVLRWGPDGYDVGLDNITFDVRQVGVLPPIGNAVPEPATWAMMIGGFGLVGGALRRRKGLRPAYA